MGDTSVLVVRNRFQRVVITIRRGDAVRIFNDRYHFDLRTADIAYRACRHLLKTLHMLDSPARVSPDPARIITVTHSLVPTTAAEFSFERRFDGLQVIEKAGTLIARDGSTEIRTPYDDCVLLMPALLPSDGATALRLGRAKEFPDQ